MDSEFAWISLLSHIVVLGATFVSETSDWINAREQKSIKAVEESEKRLLLRQMEQKDSKIIELEKRLEKVEKSLEEDTPNDGPNPDENLGRAPGES